MTHATQLSGRLIPQNRQPTAPGEMLFKEFLEPEKISMNAFAKAIGVTYARLHEFITGKRGLTQDTAWRLEQATGWPAANWMELQFNLDLYAMTHESPPPAIRRIKRLPAFAE